MKSYAYIERIEDGVAVIELRLTAIDNEFQNEKKQEKHQPRKMVEIFAEELIKAISGVKERDIVVVEHTDGNIQKFCYIDYKEKQRRLEIARIRHERLKAKIEKI